MGPAPTSWPADLADDPTAASSKAEAMRRSLEAIAGLSLDTPYSGTLRLGGGRHARVLVPEPRRLRVTLDLDPLDLDNGELLCVAADDGDEPAAHEAPGNLRLARGPGGPALLADVLLDPASVAAAVREIRVALARMVGARPVRHEEHPLDPETVEQAITDLRWDEQAVVRHEDHWELRPRLRGSVVPVRLTREPNALLLRHTVVRGRRAVAARTVLTDHARRFHARLSLCRLAWAATGPTATGPGPESNGSGRALVVESRLLPALVTPAALEATTRAVAAATCHVRTPLRLLTDQPDLAASYAAVFLPSAVTQSLTHS